MKHRVNITSGAVLAILLLGTVAAAAAEQLVSYTLKQRQAEELIPIIKPLLPANSAISGQGYTLIVRGDEQAHSVVSQILGQLDHKLQNLQISVRFSSPAVTHDSAAGGRVRIRTGDDDTQVSASGGEVPVPAPASVDIRGKDGRISVGAGETYSTIDDSSDYRLRVLEGNAAFIHSGSDVPYGTQTVYPGGVVQGSIELQPVRSGFYVRPRLNGDQVLLDIYPQQERLPPGGAGQIETQHAQTTLSGTLGEWIEIAAVSQSVQTTDKHTLYSTRQSTSSNRSIYVKVEITR